MTDSKKNDSEKEKSHYLERLCLLLTGKNKENSQRLLVKAVTIFNKWPKFCENLADEFVIAERIKEKITKNRSEKDGFLFVEQNIKLQKTSIVKKRREVLHFLLCVSDNVDSSSSCSFASNLVQLLSVIDQAKESTSHELQGIPSNPSTSSVAQIPMTLDIAPKKSASQNTFQSLSLTTTPSDQKICVKPQFFHNEISEIVLLQDFIFCLQGINGKFLKFDHVTKGYLLDSKLNIHKSRRDLILRLAELGWLHNRVRNNCENLEKQVEPGQFARSLETALREQLTEYYRWVALLQTRIQQEIDGLMSPQIYMLSSESSSASITSNDQPFNMTFRQVQVSWLEPRERMKWLAIISDGCRDSRGGALASKVYTYLRHGDPSRRLIVKQLLTAVCKPLFMMLTRWIVDGELEDPYNEFFIQANNDVTGERLWHEKYHVRKEMLPCFIPMEQARKILAIGKNINFLREICQDYSPINGRASLKARLDETSVEALFSDVGDLEAMMDRAYLETSRRVLDVLNGQYQFLDHLQALRRYMLLGQGDFFRHFIELIEPELIKPANQLYPHNLTAILETAIRATNAQFEKQDILERLDVRQLEIVAGDIGWDVFSLDYHVTGPVSTILADDPTAYLMLFHALWRAKRMEWILSRLWKRKTTSAKMSHKIPESAATLQQSNLLISELVHFINQMQYYFLFEVLECSWDQLIKKVGQAEYLDDIIKAHNDFLLAIKAGTFLDERSNPILVQLRCIYDVIVQLQACEDKLHESLLAEVEERKRIDKYIEEHGTDIKSEQTREEEKRGRLEFLPPLLSQLRFLASTYQQTVRQFMLMLASQTEVSLQLLSSRLDFNEYYHRRDKRLSMPLTYQHRRQSGLENLQQHHQQRANVNKNQQISKNVKQTRSTTNVK